MSNQEPDCCLLLEGTYPYVFGGVSTWIHNFILAQPERTFYVLTLLAPGFKTKVRYELPKNVVKVQNMYLQHLPRGRMHLPTRQRQELFAALEENLISFIEEPQLTTFDKIQQLIVNKNLGSNVLMASLEAWDMICNVYNKKLPHEPFADWFWSWQGLMGGLYSILLNEVPLAKMYHATCTGYAGAMLAKAHLCYKRPCIVTEHGIYTNERRMEIAAAEWLTDHKAQDLTASIQKTEYSVRRFWLDIFASYSNICYQASDKIITLFDANKELQMIDGAEEQKIDIIPNGIDIAKYSKIKHTTNEVPLIALVGRAVQIKGIKIFLKAVSRIKDANIKFRAEIIGPTDEDEEYFQECLELIDFLGIKEHVTFTGKQELTHILSKVDVLALASLSEAQPLILLEGGASGIVAVATDVGACREILYGTQDEEPALGQGGFVCAVTNYAELADSIIKLLKDKELYARCSAVIKKRVEKYYSSDLQNARYKDIYDQLIEGSS